MKIIGIDNLNREGVSDILIVGNVKSGWGKLLVKLLRENMNEHTPYYPLLVEDNYELYEWQP